MSPAIPIKDSWKFCPQCGAAANVVGQHPFHCRKCEYRHYFSPCTAVGALIVDAAGHMLFIVRGKDPGAGKLGLPGGFVDARETAEQALVREVGEELNLQVTEFSYLASFPNVYAYAGVIIDVTDLFFVAHVASFDSITAQAGEVTDWKFVAPGSVTGDMLAFDTHRLAIDAYRKHTAADGR